MTDPGKPEASECVSPYLNRRGKLTALYIITSGSIDPTRATVGDLALARFVPVESLTAAEERATKTAGALALLDNATERQMLLELTTERDGLREQLTAASLLASGQRERAEKAEAARDSSQAALEVALREKREMEELVKTWKGVAAERERNTVRTSHVLDAAIRYRELLAAKLDESELKLASERARRERLAKLLDEAVPVWAAWRVDVDAALTESGYRRGASAPAPPSEAQGGKGETLCACHSCEVLPQLHEQVAEMCEYLGSKRNEVPCDTWHLRDLIVALNNAAADLVAEAVGPYDPPQRGSNLERLYRLVTRSQPTPTREAKDSSGIGVGNAPDPVPVASGVAPVVENTGHLSSPVATAAEGEPKVRPGSVWKSKYPDRVMMMVTKVEDDWISYTGIALDGDGTKFGCDTELFHQRFVPLEPPPASPPASDADGERKDHPITEMFKLQGRECTGTREALIQLVADADLLARRAVLKGSHEDATEACRFVIEEGAAAFMGLREPPASPPLPVELGPADALRGDIVKALRRRDSGWDFPTWREFATWLVDELERNK